MSKFCENGFSRILPSFRQVEVLVWKRGKSNQKCLHTHFVTRQRCCLNRLRPKKQQNFLYGFTGTGNIFFPFTRFILTIASLNIYRTQQCKKGKSRIGNESTTTTDIFITIFCLLLFRRPCIHTSLFFFFGSGYFCVID